MALAKQRHFDILRQVLGMVEERDKVPVSELAAAVGVRAEELRTLLGPVLFLEFPTSMGDWIETTHDFLLNEDDELELEDHHWLRDLASAPPSADAALRLLVAGLAMQSVATSSTPDLDRAVTKLRGVVDTELQVSLPSPPCLGVAQEALAIGRSLRFRYVRDHDDVISDREVLPYRVYCRWGHWYVQGREVGGDAVKQFRIDRMQGATIGDVLFDPPPDSEIPEWFDLSRHERTVRLRLAPRQAEALARPNKIRHEVSLSDGRVELDVTVAGGRRLDYLLLTLDPDVEVVSPPEARERQRQLATELLASYQH
jgi:predicted DNA-binding transcriptional regulator YafY